MAAASCAVVGHAVSAVAVVRRCVNVTAEVPPFAFQENLTAAAGRAHQGGVGDDPLGIAEDGNIACGGGEDDLVLIVLENRLDLTAAKPVFSSGEDPAVA